MITYLGALLVSTILASLVYVAANKTIPKKDRIRLLKYLIWAVVAVNATRPAVEAAHRIGQAVQLSAGPSG